jgi:signal transduction histidine kinase
LPSRPRPSARHANFTLELWLLANHELRQPIGSLSLLAGALKSDCSPNQRRAIASQIEVVTRSFERMLDELYRLSSPVPDPIADGLTLLPSALRTAIEELSPAAANAGIQFLPSGLDRPEAAIGLHLPAMHMTGLLKAMLLYPIKLGTGHTVDISVHRRGRHAYVDVVFDGPDPTAAMRRQAFIELEERDGMPDQLVQGLGLAMASLVARHLDLELSTGTSRGGRQRLTLRVPISSATPSD